MYGKCAANLVNSAAQVRRIFATEFATSIMKILAKLPRSNEAEMSPCLEETFGFLEAGNTVKTAQVVPCV